MDYKSLNDIMVSKGSLAEFGRVQFGSALPFLMERHGIFENNLFLVLHSLGFGNCFAFSVIVLEHF